MNPGNRMRSDRFVLDNNIWISYFISRRIPFLLEIINKHELTIFSCDELIEELRVVLNYSHLKKFNINVGEAIKIVSGATVHYNLIYPIKRYVPAYVNDDFLIALALQTSSSFVIST